MDVFPVYPYAFIQVPAVARQAGVEVICKDLLGIPQGRWEQTLQALIERQDPAMILITLRNTDSLTSQDYERDGSKEGDRRAYFPIERTKELIAAIRAVSDLKITVGGFGFSVLLNEIMRFLRPDLGVFGGPDPTLCSPAPLAPRPSASPGAPIDLRRDLYYTLYQDITRAGGRL